MSKQISNAPTTTSSGAPKLSAEEVQAHEEQVKKAKMVAKKAAKRAKRVTALQLLAKEQGYLAANVRLSFREWRDGITFIAGGKEHVFLKPTEGDKSWKRYCEWKGGVSLQYWMEQAAKPVSSAKSIERKKARLEKAKLQMAALEKELLELEAAK